MHKKHADILAQEFNMYVRMLETHTCAHYVCRSSCLAGTGIGYFGHVPAHVHLEAKHGLARKLCVDEGVSFYIIHSLVPYVPFTPTHIETAT